MRTAWFGARPDLPDTRDIMLAPPQSARPPAVDLTAYVPTAFDQGPLGSCTANAIAGALMFDQQLQHEPLVAPSRLFIYYEERNTENSLPADAGAAIRNGIKTVASLGAPPEDVWPYDVTKLNETPPEYAYELATLHKAISYQRVPRDQFREALSTGYPVVFAISIYEPFESEEVAHSGVVPLPTAGDNQVGGHAMLMCGYDDNAQQATALNSWGVDWGLQGLCKIPYSYLLDPSLSFDMWRITQIA